MKIKLTFLLLFVVSASFAQIKVLGTQETPETIGHVKKMGGFHVYCEKYSDNTYHFTFRDLNYTSITELETFSFKDVDNAFENFYAVIINGLETLPEPILIELPEGVLRVIFTKSYGKHVFNFNFTPTGSGYESLSIFMNEKDANILFGKAEKNDKKKKKKKKK